MSKCAKSKVAAPSFLSWETRLVVGSVFLLSGLAVADRLVAWLIGEFPTSSLLWEIRFQYLRPIAIYHDLVELNLGSWSPLNFSILMITAGALIAGGALSKVRLARAVSCHLLFGAAAALVVLCFDQGLSIQSRAVIGTPSVPYALFGGLLASMSAALCFRIHAEYVGWNASSSRALRLLRISFARARSNLGSAVIEVIEQLNPAPSLLRAGLVRQRVSRQRNLAAR